MHRTKKLTVTTAAAALLMGAGMSSAMATSNGNGNDNERVTICHHTGSRIHPQHTITVAQKAVQKHIENHGDTLGACEPTTPGGGGNPGGGNGGCVAHSDSSDYSSQRGILNVGNVGLHLGNLLAQPLCQASALTNPAVALLGEAFSGSDLGGGLLSGSSLGSGILSGSPLGILGAGPGYLLSGLTTDVNVMADVLLHF